MQSSMQVQRASGSIAPVYLWSVSRFSRFTPAKDPVPIVQKVGWNPGPVWTAGKISPLPGFDPRTKSLGRHCLPRPWVCFRPLLCKTKFHTHTTPRSRVLQKLTGYRLIRKFLAFHGTRRFITTFTRAGTPIQNKYKVYNVMCGDSNCKGNRGQRLTLHSAEVM